MTNAQFKCRMIGALIAAAFSTPIFAQEAADPDQCRFSAAHYRPIGGEEVRKEQYRSREGDFSFDQSFAPNVRARLKFDTKAATSSSWRFRLISYQAGCPHAYMFEVGPETLARHGDNLLSPVMCGRLRLEWEINDFGDAPPVELTVYNLKVPHQQLGIYDSENRLNGPNWCEVNAFEADDESPAKRLYAPAPERFSTAMSSAVFIGWEEKDFEPSWSVEYGRKEYHPRFSLTSCSGFFITQDLVLTNRHCVCPVEEKFGRACPGGRNEPAFDGAPTFTQLPQSQQLEAREWRIWPHAARKISAGRNAAPLFQRVKPVILGATKSKAERPRPVTGPPWPLDYALLRVDPGEIADTSIAIAPAHLDLDDVRQSDELLIAHYPGNYPFAVSYDRDCKVVREEQLHSEPYKSASIGHGCDTHGGSSGSPVFRRDLSGVIGVHFCCQNELDYAAFKIFEKETSSSVEELSKKYSSYAKPANNPNKFVSIRRIVCDIRQRDPGVFEEIARGQGWLTAMRTRIGALCARD